MSGPFDSEQQARELPAVQAVYRAFDASPGVGRMAPHNHRMLGEACAAARVRLGAYDRRILVWLAGWTPQTCAVVAGLITRAHDAGLAVNATSAGLVRLPPGAAVLTGDQAATVARALADAEKYRMREAAGHCADCEADPRGCCDDHLGDIEAAQEYHDLGAILGGAR